MKDEKFINSAFRRGEILELSKYILPAVIAKSNHDEPQLYAEDALYIAKVMIENIDIKYPIVRGED